jgi:hypothetical protein
LTYFWRHLGGLGAPLLLCHGLIFVGCLPVPAPVSYPLDDASLHSDWDGALGGADGDVDNVGGDVGGADGSNMDGAGDARDSRVDGAGAAGRIDSGAGGGDMGREDERSVAECTTITQCLTLCSDEVCREQCLANVSQDALNRLDAFTLCAQANECVVQDGYDQHCLRGHCGDELLACLGVPTGNGSCAELFACALRCPQGADGEIEPACQSACRDATSAEGYEQASALAACAQTCPPDDNACYESECAMEILVCLGDG